MKKRYLAAFMRHPKVLQEVKANLDKIDHKIKHRKRNLRFAFCDDLFVKNPQSWKYRRKSQYRELKFDWEEFQFNYKEYRELQAVIEKIRNSGYYFEHSPDGYRWFGPKFLKVRK